MSTELSRDSPYILAGQDEQENTRLSHQARAIELAQNGKLTSLDVGNFLDASTGGEGSTVLDIACGPGDWAKKVASRYPNSEIHAYDNVPRWYTASTDIPPNLSLFEHDYYMPLDKFPDNSFDLVRLGTISGGLPSKKNYESVFGEAARLVKPGGWLISAAEPEMDGWRLMNPASSFDPSFGKIVMLSEEETKRPMRWAQLFPLAKPIIRAMQAGKMPVLSNAGTEVIPNVLKGIESLDPSTMIQHSVAVPLTAWSDDPVLKEAGEAMRPDSERVPIALKRLLMSGFKGTQEANESQFEELAKAYSSDLDTPGTAIIWVNNSIQKKSGPSLASST